MKRSILLLTTFLALASFMKAQTYDVEFIVDMNTVTESFTTPEVNGNFNGWCGGCAPMSDDDGDNVWNLTIELEAGTYEFKFAADTWTIQEELTEGSECTLTTSGFTNRIITVTEDMELDTVCWASCDACEDVLPSYSVLFRVDMSEVTESFTTPEVNGVFNGWCGGCAPLSDDDGDNVWELEITLDEGTYEYKFAADTWAIQEELTAGSPCTSTIDGFTNRTINVTADIELDPVCWGACEACSPVGIVSSNTSGLTIWPQPVDNVLNIELGNAGLDNSFISLVNMNGVIVLQEFVNTQTTTLEVDALPAGLYMLVIQNHSNILSSASIIIQ